MWVEDNGQWLGNTETWLTIGDIKEIQNAQAKIKTQTWVVSDSTAEVLENQRTISGLFSEYIKKIINHPVNRLEKDLRGWFSKEKNQKEEEIMKYLETNLSENDKMELTRVYSEALKKGFFGNFKENIRKKIKEIVISFLETITDKSEDWEILLKASKMWHLKIVTEEYEKLQKSLETILRLDEKTLYELKKAM